MEVVNQGRLLLRRRPAKRTHLQQEDRNWITLPLPMADRFCFVESITDPCRTHFFHNRFPNAVS